MVRASDLVVPTRVAYRKDGTVIDLTGASVKWRVGPQDRLSTSALMIIGNGVTIVSLTAGTYSRIMSASVSADFAPGLYRQTVKVTEADGSITVVEQGFIDIGRDLP